MKNCRVCHASVEPFLSFGRMPRGNGFLTAAEFQKEYFFDLAAGLCGACKLVQLMDQPEPEAMFHGSYPFLTGSSQNMRRHFEDLAARLIQSENLGPSDFVAEIGSNDGTLLSCFARAGIPHLGIDPSQNVADSARDSGVQTLCAFFNQESAAGIVKRHGLTRLFLGANVLCHITDLNSVLAGVRLLLKPDGLAVFEDPYLLDVLEKTAYDQIYDEHASLFSVQSLSAALLRHDLEIFDAERIHTHGGSLRYFAAPVGTRPVSSRITDLVAAEQAACTDRLQTFRQFQERCEKSRDKLRDLIRQLKGKGKRIAGYAATSKSTTTLNYCGLGPQEMDYVADTTPGKQGKFTPGSHIPVKSVEFFRQDAPDYAILFGWNHREEILAKESEFTRKGGRWILYVPEVCIL